jgi:hypothetical protein
MSAVSCALRSECESTVQMDQEYSELSRKLQEKRSASMALEGELHEEVRQLQTLRGLAAAKRHSEKVTNSGVAATEKLMCMMACSTHISFKLGTEEQYLLRETST